MDLTIVIPSYNMESGLKRTLNSLARQRLQNDSRFEVVVVDDGSTDATATVLAQAAPSLRIKYVFLERDERSCRSRARNAGINAASGRRLLFIDSGVELEREFVKLMTDEAWAAEACIVAHRTLGLFTSGRREPSPVFENEIGVLERDEDWGDCRQTLAQELAHRLPAPWGLGWTCALSVERSVALALGGFDESFLGWGAEDIDFCRRASEIGVPTTYRARPTALHRPHAAASFEEKEREHLLNKRRMHEKFFAIDTELTIEINCMRVNLFLPRLERLVLGQAIPPYTAGVVGRLRRELAGPILVMGAAGPDFAADLGASHVLVHSTSAREAFRERLADVQVLHLFGVHTPFPDQAFQAAILTDALRLYPSFLQRAVLRECARVSRKVLLLCTSDEGGRNPTFRRMRELYREIEGWGWSDLAELRGALSAEARTKARETTLDGCSILSVSLERSIEDPVWTGAQPVVERTRVYRKGELA